MIGYKCTLLCAMSRLLMEIRQMKIHVYDRVQMHPAVRNVKATNGDKTDENTCL